MLFNSFTYLVFLALIVCVYWLIRSRPWQNLLLLMASYLFYGWIHHWFCILLAVSTIVDYFCGLGMERYPSRKKIFLILSLATNIGMLGFFKYFNFFISNVSESLQVLGFEPHPMTLAILLPAGISFYTFQTLSYTIDIYRGSLKPRRNFIDFALFVSFFPQLIAGPIERASHLLPEMEKNRDWKWNVFLSAFPLLLNGYIRKMVIADNVGPFVDRIFLLSHPPMALLLMGAVGFAIQIYADFSGYTLIARGSARLMGFELMRNFNSPYLAISPSDFWRRWHISFSSWIKDYLYIPLGGSRITSRWAFLLVLLATMGLSGLWHGAAWNFVAWGIYHALLLWGYHQLGFAGRWSPQGPFKLALAWSAMISFTLFGWLIFRASDLKWLLNALGNPIWQLTGQQEAVAVILVFLYLFYSLPLLVQLALDRYAKEQAVVRGFFGGLGLMAIILLGRVGAYDFIYFQF